MDKKKLNSLKKMVTKLWSQTIIKKSIFLDFQVFLFYVKYKEAIDNLIDGFHSIIPVGLLQLFSSEELSYLISGEPIIYANELIDKILCCGRYTR